MLERNQFSLGRLLRFATLCIETGVSCVSSARRGQTQPSVSNETVLVKAAIYFSHALVPVAARALRVVGQFNILDAFRPWLFSFKVIVRMIMLFFFCCFFGCACARGLHISTTKNLHSKPCEPSPHQRAANVLIGGNFMFLLVDKSCRWETDPPCCLVWLRSSSPSFDARRSAPKRQWVWNPMFSAKGHIFFLKRNYLS